MRSVYHLHIEGTGYGQNYLIDSKTATDEFLEENAPGGYDKGFYVDEEVYVDFKADWARIIENHLDILHVFWMHGDTIPDKNVNRETITSFNQKIKRDNRQIESIYSYKTKSHMKIGYACINSTLQTAGGITTNRSMRQKTYNERGLDYCSELALQNVKDLVNIIKWNNEMRIKQFRMSSDMVIRVTIFYLLQKQMMVLDLK